jgi:RimJ/RimL family protein N-acetyltransferase
MLPAPATTSLILATNDDLSFLSALADDRAVAPFLAVGAGEADVLRGLLSDAASYGRPHGLFVIRSLEDEPVGGLALRVVNRRSRICELSRLLIRPDKRRAGIAWEAVARACRIVLVDHAFHRIELEVYGDNLAAQALSERVGFVREGRRRTGGASIGSTACISGCSLSSSSSVRPVREASSDASRTTIRTW